MSAIVGLFKTCCPFAILRRVRAIDIDTVNRVTRRRFSPHISEKVFVSSLKCVPSPADANSPGSIMFKISKVGVRAPSAHRTPCSIFWRHLAATFTVLKVSLATKCSSVTATTHSFSSVEVTSIDNASGSALAPHSPKRTAIASASDKMSYRQTTKLFTDQVFELRHVRILL